MTQALTFDDVWRMFQETDRKFKKTDRKFEKADRRIKKIELMFQETDRKFQETDRKFQETDRKFQETDRKFQETDRKFQETDRQMQETDRKMQETDRKMQETDRKMLETFQESERLIREMRESSLLTDRKIKEVSQQIGSLGSRWGEFVEGFIAPACETLFAQRGIPVHRVSIRVKAKSQDGTRRMEIDVVVDNTDSVVLVEVKSRLTVMDVRNHLRRMEEFKTDYLSNKAIRVIGAVAGILMDHDAEMFAMENGLFVIVQSGENVKLANGPDFVPVSF
ncbi:MAG: hypothetical protein H7839_10435 [Magnetococcus sp. YQC-5]